MTEHSHKTFMSYLKAVKEDVDRPLTQAEISTIMASYIKPINVDSCVKQLKKGEKK